MTTIDHLRKSKNVLLSTFYSYLIIFTKLKIYAMDCEIPIDLQLCYIYSLRTFTYVY